MASERNPLNGLRHVNHWFFYYCISQVSVNKSIICLLPVVEFLWSRKQAQTKNHKKLTIAYNVLLTCLTGECCVALRSLIGASEQFETFLCHRGEDMGSIRGRVRLHVPKDRRAVREKVYGGSNGQGQSTTPLLLLDYHFPLLLHKLSGQSHVASFLWFLNDPGFGFTLAGLLTASSFGSWLTDPEQMHPETLKKDR